MSVSLYQLKSATPVQMMSYVIKTENGKLAVIDGGNKGDAEYLLDFLYKLTNGEKPVVETWFLTHNHIDHVDAFGVIVDKYFDKIQINRVYSKMINDEFYQTCTGDPAYANEALLSAFGKLGGVVQTAQIGDVCEIDGVKFETLYACEDVFKENVLNNSSLVFMMYAEGQRVLFLGDLGEEAGDRVLQLHGEEKLKSDFVQMAHHGQNGVKRSFYQAVMPKGCLWPTPKWLWDNDAGKGYDTHIFATVKTRKWMQELGASAHFKDFEGTCEIVIPYNFC